MFLRATDSFKTLRGVKLSGTAYTGPIVVSSAAETLEEIVFERWLLENNVNLNQHAKWGKITYNEKNCRHRNVTIRGIDKEHAVYNHSPRGEVLYEDCTFEDCGAQGVQITYRDPESDTPNGYLETGTHKLVRCSIIKCGQPRGYGRASYALSFFGRQEGDGSSPRMAWGCPVELWDTAIKHNSQGLYELRGALLCEWRPSLTVYGGYTAYQGTADRDLWHVHNVDVVAVDGHGFIGTRKINIDGATNVNFSNCTGSTQVWINGVNMGPVSSDIVWTA